MSRSNVCGGRVRGVTLKWVQKHASLAWIRCFVELLMPLQICAQIIIIMLCSIPQAFEHSPNSSSCSSPVHENRKAGSALWQGRGNGDWPIKFDV